MCNTVKTRVEVGISQESDWVAARAANDGSHNFCLGGSRIISPVVSGVKATGARRLQSEPSPPCPVPTVFSDGATQSEPMIRSHISDEH